MTNTDLNLHVPAAIVGLPSLSLAEKVALAYLLDHPGCSNASLARLLGLSQRGVEALLRRLRERGLIAQVGKGRARQHRLRFPVEHHIKCEQNESESHTKSGESEIVESHTKSGQASAPPGPDPPAPAPTQADSPERLLAIAVDDEIECAGECIGRADFEGALQHCRLAKDRVGEFPAAIQVVKIEALAFVTEHEDRILACKLAFEYGKATQMPRSKLNAVFARIKDLTREKLALIRPALDAQAKLGTPADISALLAG
jgi:DNA-binding CsgD family transcriptional regulator